MLLRSASRIACLLALQVALIAGAVAPAAAQSAASSVAGTVTDQSGAPLADAAVALTGAASYRSTTDNSGAFTFSRVNPGFYSLTVTKAGFSAFQTTIVVAADQNQTVAVRMQPATFTSLQTIATVQSRGRGSFNTTAAAVNVVPAQTFIDQGQPQVIRVLNQVPGVQISFPDGSANGVTAGSITFPTIRGASSYETASLIDGHPLATQSYGDYVTSFLQSYLIGSVEVIKGPGADAPEVNNAIGGTLNFRTIDPTPEIKSNVLVGFDNHGGTFTNLGVSDTIGRVGFVADVASLNSPSALNGHGVYFDPTGPDSGSVNGLYLTYPFQNYTQVGTTQSYIQTTYPLVACCYISQGYLNNLGELFKVRYQFSNATSATVSYLGGQAFSDQNGNVGNVTYSTFTPVDNAPHGGLVPGQVIPVDYLYVGGQNYETNNEPIVQAEISSTLGNDTVIGRYYHASINRLGFQGSPSGNTESYNLYGTSTGDGVSSYAGAFNGQNVAVGFQDLYQQTEADKLAGFTFQYTHPFNGSDDLTLSVDQTNTQSLDYNHGSFYSVTLPAGSSQLYTTFLLRGRFGIGSKLKATISDYQNVYRNTYPSSCPFAFGFSDCNYNGSNVTFATSTTSHNDPRIGFVYQPSGNLAARLAIGSSIAPPYLALLSQISGGTASAGQGFATVAAANPNLLPETAFGFDLGADYRMKDGITTWSGDVYNTNLFNHYFQQLSPSPYTCATYAGGCQDGNGNPVTSTIPLYYQLNTNVSNTRFQGIELEVRHLPQLGFGFDLSGSLQRGYVYNLAPNFYCSFVPTAANPCNPSTYDQNLNVVPNENLNGGGIGINSSSIGGNVRIPYAQGNAEFQYAFKNGALVLFGDTLYGKNNSLNVPPFGVAYASVRYPVTDHLVLQVSGDNIFNAYNGLIPVYGGGVQIPLANGGSSATTSNVLGPATYRFIVTAKVP